MRVLSPERVAISTILFGAGVDEIDQLDFRLGADEGVVVNEVESHLLPAVTAADVNVHMAAMLSLNADHTATDMLGLTDDTDIDSPMIFLHRHTYIEGVDDGAGGGLGAITVGFQRKSWHAQHIDNRPKSNDLLVHICDAGATITGNSIMLIRYQLVQFSMAELGVLNAFRRF